jgi:pyruvate formate lyase activating enzyme
MEAGNQTRNAMEALLYHRLEDGVVRCDLCRHHCRIEPGKRGLCAVRENRGGTLHTLVYGHLVAAHVDPIEKKPLFHFLPATLSYSIATVGCNFRCRFCQNADIAQMPADHDGRIMGRATTPAQVVEAAKASGSRSIAYTYTEPTVFWEFARDTAELAHRHGLRNVFVTNGYMSEAALDLMGTLMDAANVDLKAFREKSYLATCGARLSQVCDSLRQLRRRGVLLEVTTLLVPGFNDDEGELRELAEFLAGELGPETPWHVSRFHPAYRLLDRPPTAPAAMRRAREIGMAAGLRYVYIGNLPGERGERTLCHSCGMLLIDRHGFQVVANHVRQGCCPRCQTGVHGVGLG